MRRGIVIAGILLALFFGLVTPGVSDAEMLTLGQLRYRGGNWNPRPNALKPWVQFIESRSSLTVNGTLTSVAPDSPDLYLYPFIIWTGDQEFQAFTEKELENLRRYLKFGGFLMVDDAQAAAGFGFDNSAKREIEKLFPGEGLKTLPSDHTVFRSFFILQQAVGRQIQSKNLEGIVFQGRTVLVYTSNDLMGAMSKDPFGNWEYPIPGEHEALRKDAFRLGVNLLMYALCDDYKKDALHVDYILKRRRLP